jgi:hypothetical protein
LRAQDDLPWICAGDFNEITSQEEQLGRNERSEAQMNLFRHCLMDCRLTDLGYSGYPFTWDNRREGSDNVQARLDRAMGDIAFLQLFPQTCVEHIPSEESDHFALLIKVAVEAPRHAPSRSKGFMFEEMWTRHEMYEETVIEAWRNTGFHGSGFSALWQRLKDVSSDLKRWSFHTFGLVSREIKRLRSGLEEAKLHALNSGSNSVVRDIEKQLHEMYEREEIMYKQRSMQDWLKAGD